MGWAWLWMATVAAAAQPLSPETGRRVDVELAAMTSLPERFTLCGAFHPSQPFELDFCVGADRGELALTTHAFWRKYWVWRTAENQPSWELGVGPGLGLRAMRYCPYAVCAQSYGPEALLSVELVKWVSPRWGLSLQADAGLALVWAPLAPGILQHSFRFPARVLAGVVF